MPKVTKRPISAIRKLRLQAGLTQSQVARALEIHETLFVRWEWGQTLPNARNLLLLADFFKVDPRVLVPPPGLDSSRSSRGDAA